MLSLISYKDAITLIPPQNCTRAVRRGPPPSSLRSAECALASFRSRNLTASTASPVDLQHSSMAICGNAVALSPVPSLASTSTVSSDKGAPRRQALLSAKSIQSSGRACGLTSRTVNPVPLLGVRNASLRRSSSVIVRSAETPAETKKEEKVCSLTPKCRLVARCPGGQSLTPFDRGPCVEDDK